MKLLVVVASKDSLCSAGTRIRYLRLSNALAQRGCALEVLPIDQLDGASVSADVVVISKVMTVRSIVLARRLRQRGVRVGVDLFDDYFSQKRLSGTQPQQIWLSQLVGQLDFALCSTAVLADVLTVSLPGLPVHQLHDCHGDRLKQLESLAESLRYRLQRVQLSGELPVLWFGMGDHPLFEVGLADLAQHADQLRRLQQTGLRVNLSVLTNERALTAEGLQRIRRLPVPATVELWSEARESEGLEQSVLAFLPVADTPFSRAKSPTRAITALEHGCQVLTSATPVYSMLAHFIYTNPAELLNDLAEGRTHLRPDTLDALQMCLYHQANPAREAERLCDFLAGLSAPALAAEKDPVCVIDCLRPAPLPALSSAADPSAFSVRSPLSKSQPSDDLSFLIDRSGQVVLSFSPSLWQALPALHALKQPHIHKITPQERVELPLTALAVETWQQLVLQRAVRSQTLVEQLSIRPAVMEITQALMAKLLPASQQLVNEELHG